MSKAIDDLKHDHDAILSALKILDRIAEDIEKGATPGRADLAKFIDFLKEFADKCHHGKEEGMLFPALTQAGMPERGGPVGVMLSEHVEGRRFIKEMEGAIASTPDYRAFSAAAKRYSSLLQNHIGKENDVLFPMAENLLKADQLEKLYEGFETHEKTVIGHGRHEELHQILKEMKAKYLR